MIFDNIFSYLQNLFIAETGLSRFLFIYFDENLVGGCLEIILVIRTDLHPIRPRNKE